MFLLIYGISFSQRTTFAEEAERSEMLAILAVPAAMTTHDLLQFVAPVK